jgi:chromate reductase, NAD(P)H dehydrogenase (quinone)
MPIVRALAFAGSLRKESWNRKLLRLAIEAARAEGLETLEFDLRDIPLYDADVEATGFPPAVEAFRRATVEAAALIIATPEYNNSVPGVLKNAIDWASRPPNALDGKVAAILGASAGNFGTVSAQRALRPVLVTLNVLTLPAPRVFIARAAQAFDSDGTLKDHGVAGEIHALMRRLAHTTRALSAPPAPSPAR